MSLLSHIAWCFDKTDYPTREAFSAEMAQYQLDILKERAAWHPDEVIIENPSVEVAYEYWGTDDDLKFDDEQVLAVYKDEEADEKEVVVRFTADNGTHFTALELLHKLHQRLRHRDLGDHYFFEGLAAPEDSESQQPPLFYLRCGS